MSFGEQLGSFAGWVEDRTVTPMVADPALQALLEALYLQVFARTYGNGDNQRTILSIAYGSDQTSEATAVRRPEFCYIAQGFSVDGAGIASIDARAGPLRVQRLVASVGQRVEPIACWVTLDDRATLPGLDRKLKRLRFGFKGQIADGMLVRVSSLGAGPAAAFTLQDGFIRDLRKALPSNIQHLYFGTPSP